MKKECNFSHLAQTTKPHDEWYADNKSKIQWIKNYSVNSRPREKKYTYIETLNVWQHLIMLSSVHNLKKKSKINVWCA